MDIQAKKLTLINRIINNQDENILDRIEMLFKQEGLPSLTKEDIVKRSEQAQEDYKAGRVYSTQEVLKMSEDW